MGGLHLGTSGWSYPEWKGAFYPAKIAGGDMLPFYARHFNTVEINNSFYRMPDPEAVRAWTEQAPPGFLFSFKAHRAITHRKRFAEGSEFLDRFAELLTIVGSRLGPVLFQLDTIADVPQLADFLAMAKARFGRVVVEFRHKSWFAEATYEVLRGAGVAMCQTETDEGADPLLDAPDFAYRRLRRSACSAAELGERLAELRALAAGREVFAYLKHDAANAVLLRDLLAGGG